MSSGQWRVTGLLVLLLILEAQINPDIKAYNAQVKKVGGSLATGNASVPLPKFNIKYMIYWGVAALALIALAGPAPDVATLLAVILLVGVAAGHASELGGIITKSTGSKS